jgi:hypothetical protein
VGLIEKSIRGRGNQKLAAPVFTNTALSKQEVVDVIKRLCEELTAANIAALNEARAGGFWKSSKVASIRDGHVTYYVEVESRQIWVSFFGPPKNIHAIDPKARLKANQAYWLAEVVFMNREPDTPDGEEVVRLTLKRWVTDQDGKLRNRDKYELFAERLHAAISVDA